MSPRFVLVLSKEKRCWLVRDRRGTIPDLELANGLDAQFVLNALNQKETRNA